MDRLKKYAALPPVPDKCPECGSTITIGSGDNPGWSCDGCNIFSFQGRYEHPDIAAGRKRSDEFEGVFCMDKKFLVLPARTQLGILRERHRTEIRRKLKL